MLAKKPRSRKEKKIIGWREYVSIPEWGIRDIRAKIDTGARTSSLHVEDIRLLKYNHISFYIVLRETPSLKRKKVVTTRVKRGRVKSSTGARTERWYVRATIKMGEFQREIIFNLVSRQGMNFRMLIGRKAIEEAFLVDVDKSFLSGREKKDYRK